MCIYFHGVYERWYMYVPFVSLMRARKTKQKTNRTLSFLCRLKTWLWLLCRMHRLSFSLSFFSHPISSHRVHNRRTGISCVHRQHCKHWWNATVHTVTIHWPLHFTQPFEEMKWRNGQPIEREIKTFYLKPKQLNFFFSLLILNWRLFRRKKIVNETEQKYDDDGQTHFHT